MSERKGSFKDHLEYLQAKAAAAVQLVAIFEEFPELEREFLEIVRGNHQRPRAAARDNDGPVTNSSELRRNPTAFKSIAGVFLRNGNEWTDTGTLSRASGVARNVAATILWSAHRKDFESQPHETHKRMKNWRLRPEKFAELHAQQAQSETLGTEPNEPEVSDDKI